MYVAAVRLIHYGSDHIFECICLCVGVVIGCDESIDTDGAGV